MFFRLDCDLSIASLAGRIRLISEKNRSAPNININDSLRLQLIVVVAGHVAVHARCSICGQKSTIGGPGVIVLQEVIFQYGT